jgi:hypothetical protein
MKLIINGAEVEVSKDELTQGIEKGQFEVKSDLKVFKNEDFEIFQKNIADNEYKKGKIAGEEILIKTGREKFGLEFEGKTLDNFAEALKNKALKEASVEPTKKVQELTADMDKLRGNLQEWETKYNTLQQQVETEKKQFRIENTILSKLPKDQLTIPAEDVVFILKSKNQIDLENDNLVIKQNGETLKNKTNLNPLTVDEWLPELIKPYLKTVNGGAGASDATKAAQGTMEAFLKEMEGKPSYEMQTEMQKRIKEGTLKIK